MSRVIYDSENRITQNYIPGKHRGVDLGWRSNEEMNNVYSNCAGTVYATLDNVSNGSEKGGGWGNYVLVRHDNGMFSRYAHLRNGLKVSNGQRVDENTILGVIGDSGRTAGRHLHFEVQTSASSDDRINPEPYLTKAILESSPISDNVNVTYKVRTQAHGWLSEVTNLNDYAGYQNSPITGLAVKVDRGSIKYRVHIQGGDWLDWVTGYDVNDINNGYAGDGRVIDGIQVYYFTPNDIRPYKRAKYRANGYSWVYDDSDYAGIYGTPVTKVEMTIE